MAFILVRLKSNKKYLRSKCIVHNVQTGFLNVKLTSTFHIDGLANPVLLFYLLRACSFCHLWTHVKFHRVDNIDIMQALINIK